MRSLGDALDRTEMGRPQAPQSARASRQGHPILGTFFLFCLIFLGLVALSRGDFFPKAKTLFLEKLDPVLASAGFRITKVELWGLQRLDRETVLRVLAIPPQASFFSFDAQAARQRLETLGWVAEVRIMRIFPQTLALAITERTPFARWYHKGREVLVDATGAVIGPDSTGSFAHLPLIVGAGAPKAASDLFAAITRKAPFLNDLLLNATWVANRRWDLTLPGGVTVMLPEKGLSDALATLTRFGDRLPQLTEVVSVIDLRLPRRIAFRVKRKDSAPHAPMAAASLAALSPADSGFPTR